MVFFFFFYLTALFFAASVRINNYRRTDKFVFFFDKFSSSPFFHVLRMCWCENQNAPIVKLRTWILLMLLLLLLRIFVYRFFFLCVFVNEHGHEHEHEMTFGCQKALWCEISNDMDSCRKRACERERKKKTANVTVWWVESIDKINRQRLRVLLLCGNSSGNGDDICFSFALNDIQIQLGNVLLSSHIHPISFSSAIENTQFVGFTSP